MITKERQTAKHARRLSTPASRMLLERLEINDPLAHIIQAEQTRQQVRTSQAEVEFDTDLLERNPEGFYSTVDYRDVDDDFVSSHGTSMRTMLDNSIYAARTRHRRGDYPKYGVDVDIQRSKEYSRLRAWVDGGARGCLMVQSLCPSSDELPPNEAKIMNYDQQRLRSSIAVYEKCVDGSIRGHFFSIDNHTLKSNARILDGLGIESGEPIGSTLDLLGRAFNYYPKDPSRSPRDEMLTLHGESPRSIDIDDIQLVESRDEWFDLAEVVKDCLARGEYSADYRSFVARYSLPMNGAPSIEWSAQVMELYRSRVAPHMLYSAASNTGELSINVASLPTYSATCPTSGGRAETLISTAHSLSSAELSDLQHRYAGYGRCQSCGAGGSLYGCGVFCRSCNNIWCWEYRSTSRQLSYEEVSKARRSFKYRWVY